MRIPDKFSQDMRVAIKETGYEDLIDETYEIQIRTILSEGWHEVEHDLRYKCKEEWNNFQEESRLLNGIYATLESSEWAMLTLFEKLSYSQYKMETGIVCCATKCEYVLLVQVCQKNFTHICQITER